MGSPRVEFTISQAGPAHFRQWRAELGKSDIEMAQAARIPLASYRAAEESSNIPASVHVAVLTAFKRLGKEPTPIE